MKPFYKAYATIITNNGKPGMFSQAREGAASIKTFYDEKMYLFGGRNSHPINKLEIFNPIDQTFKNLTKGEWNRDILV